ncbi:MAG: hypothetical protein U5L11_16115 [Arhodomonas sp.]|nr:hypothetical protein [Arhodomonas sp.]
MIDLRISWELPHWLYWVLLLIGPLIVMFFVWRAERRGDTPSGGTVPMEEEGNALDYLPGNALTRFIDAVSGFTGRYVAYLARCAAPLHLFRRGPGPLRVQLADQLGP